MILVIRKTQPFPAKWEGGRATYERVSVGLLWRRFGEKEVTFELTDLVSMPELLIHHTFITYTSKSG